MQHCAFIGVEHIAVVQGNYNLRLVQAFRGGERELLLTGLQDPNLVKLSAEVALVSGTGKILLRSGSRSTFKVLTCFLNNFESYFLLLHRKINSPKHVFYLKLVHHVGLCSRGVLLGFSYVVHSLLKQGSFLVFVLTAARGVV